MMGDRSPCEWNTQVFAALASHDPWQWQFDNQKDRLGFLALLSLEFGSWTLAIGSRARVIWSSGWVI